MKKNNIDICASNTFYKNIFLLIFLLCQNLSVAAEKDEDTNSIVWKQGDQFVKLVTRETVTDNLLNSNHHAVILNAQKLSAVFNQIQVRSEKTARTKVRINPLLQNNSATILGQQLKRGFEIANADQDLVFAINTLINDVGIGKKKVSVAGRVFYLDNRLHVIIGDLFVPTIPQNFYTTKTRPTKIDRRLHPHIPGSRNKASEHSKYRILSKEINLNNNNRNEWLVINIDDISATKQVTASTKTNNASHKNAPETQSGENGIPKNTITDIKLRLHKLDNLLKYGTITKEEYITIRKRILSEI